MGAEGPEGPEKLVLSLLCLARLLGAKVEADAEGEKMLSAERERLFADARREKAR